MPLKQSTLTFGSQIASRVPSRFCLHEALQEMPALESPRASSIDTDTIVVNTTSISRQLPTPSESATEVSSQSSQTETTRNLRTSRSKRVSSARKQKSVFKEDPSGIDNIEQDKIRSVSGETLVAEEVIVVDHGVAEKSDMMPGSLWDMKDTDMSANGEQLSVLVADQDDDSHSIITVREESDDEQAREELRIAKKAKMEENAKKWEDRKKDADKNATRRSGRMSLIGKAGKLLDNIKNTVLGKRARNVSESDTKKPTSGADTSSGPPSKKLRVLESEVIPDQPVRSKSVARREKKWLVAGLYAGQPRVFDVRFTENKNRQKSKTAEGTQVKENSVLPMPMFAGERLLQQGRDFKLPFDIFSPLPVGQPKPDEWKKVNKNVFVGDAAAEWRTNKYVEHSTCMCKQKCDQDCMNRYMYYECDKKNCRLTEECGNRAFEGLKQRTKLGGKYNVGVEVIKTADRGYGVRSNRTFEPNQIIVEYTGEIITQEECEHRMRSIYKDNECYYLMLFDQNMIIDATRGSIARFVNHACEPNCRMEKWTVDGKPRMALFAGDRGIMTGDELTYDYNFDPYSQKNVQACRCGSKNCRGVLGPKPKPEAKRNSPENEAGKKKEGKLSVAKKRVAEALDESKVSKKRKTISTVAVKKQLPTKARAQLHSPKRKVLVKKVLARKPSTSKTSIKLGRSDSKLKKMLVGAKNKAGSLKGRRVISASSATEALLSTPKKNTSPVRKSPTPKKKVANGPKKTSPVVQRSSSLKEKAKNISRSVRARSRTIVGAV